MIPIVDARSGKVVQVGESIEYAPMRTLDGSMQRSGFRLNSISLGVFSGKADVTTWDGDQEYRQVVAIPIKWFPKRTYGPRFPVDALRVALLPS
jgi:hypothetical protein